MRGSWKRERKGAVRAVAWALLALALVARGQLFGGASLVGVAKEWTQLSNNAQLVHIASQEVRNLAYTIRQYDEMVRQGRPLSGWQLRDAMGDLRRLSEIVALGTDVAQDASGVDALLREAFPGYDHYAGGGPGSYGEDYRRWNTRRHDAIRDAYYAADLHAVQFRDEAAATRTIERQMQTATGQMQVLQASGRLATMEVEQLQKLRQLLTVQIRMQGEILAAEGDRAAAEDAGREADREAARRVAEAAREALENSEAGGIWVGRPWD